MTTRTAAQYMAKLNATLLVTIDDATQYATVYKVAGRVEGNQAALRAAELDATQPVATMRRRRVIGEANQPAWTCVTTKGHEVTYDSVLGVTPRGLLLRLALHLINQHETEATYAALTAAHSTSQPQGQPLTLDMVEDHKPAPASQAKPLVDYPAEHWAKARTMVDDMARNALHAGDGFTVTTGNSVYAAAKGDRVAWYQGNCMYHGHGDEVEVTRGRAIELVCLDIMPSTDDRLYDWRNG